jgi:hypothetical protein
MEAALERLQLRERILTEKVEPDKELRVNLGEER